MTQNIHPTAIIDKSAEIGENVEIGAYCIIESNVKIGSGTRLRNHAQIRNYTTLGEDCYVDSFAVIGGAPQDLSYKDEPTTLVVGNRCTMREYVTMSRGTPNGKGVTTIGDDCYFMANSHVGHDCVVANNVIMANSVALAGHVTIGERVILGGLSAVHQHCRVGRHAFVGGLAAVVADVIPYGSVVGVHAHLAGLNIVGLKRRGFSRAQIHEMRSAYRMLFSNEGTMQERIEDVLERFSGIPEAIEIIEFVRAESSRPICLPRD
jgi:UDP-N-acetylglucosamine acyltransferase